MGWWSGGLVGQVALTKGPLKGDYPGELTIIPDQALSGLRTYPIHGPNLPIKFPMVGNLQTSLGQ